jgi:hypothetical protein
VNRIEGMLLGIRIGESRRWSPSEYPRSTNQQIYANHDEGTYSDGLVERTCDDVHLVELEASNWTSMPGKRPVSLTSTH